MVVGVRPMSPFGSEAERMKLWRGACFVLVL